MSGILLVACAVAVGARVVSRAEHRTQVLAFVRDLAAGTTVQSGDVNVVRVGLAPGQASVYDTASAAVLGMQLERNVARGELVTRALVETPRQSTTVVIPLASGAAPVLQRGERIVVWAVSSGCGVVELVSDVTVQSVNRGEAGLADSGQQRVVVELSDDDAVRVVEALSHEGATLRAGVVTGDARTTSPSPRRCSSATG